MNDVVDTPAKPQPIPRDALSPFGAPIGWLRTEIDRLFDDIGRPARSAFDFGMRSLLPMPALDMVEGEHDYRLTAELPGLSEQDVEVAVEDGILSVSGEKKEEADRRDGGFMLSERRYGAFARQMKLPPDVDPGAITAKVKDGVLTVTLAKDKGAVKQSRKIAVEKA